MPLSADDPPRQVKQLIKAGPGITVEWLDEHAEQTDIATTLAAMANTQGGTVVFGVRGKPQDASSGINGIEDTSTVVERVLKAALSLEPQLMIPLPRVVPVDGKEVVIAEVQSGLPHIYALDGRYLCRKERRNVGLAPKELYRLMILRGEVNFEMEPCLGATYSDLDWGKVYAYIKELHALGEVTVNDALLRRGCLVQQDDALVPTNAGILLFGKDPNRFIPSTEITAVRFAGEAMSDTFSRQDITGTLPDQIRRAETFLVDHLRKGVEIRHTMARKEHYEYPMEAARELLVNAVAHRDYSNRGDGIRLYIFKNRLEVTSPGTLPGPVTIANIKDERFSRNPAIVQVLSDMGFIERLGYGVDRVIELMRQQDLREPEFIETGGGFRVSLFNQSTRTEVEDTKHPTQPRPKFAPEHSIPLNPRQETALEHLRKPENTRITNSELQRLFPDVHAETIRRDLANLVAKGLLNKMGQKRGSYYVLNTDT